MSRVGIAQDYQPLRFELVKVKIIIITIGGVTIDGIWIGELIY
jgi:hypothetical protein